MSNGNTPFIEKVLVTGGNLAMATPGDLYSVVKTKHLRAKRIYNVAPKQLVAFIDKKDGTIPQKVTETSTINDQDYAYLHFGVGFDSDGDGIVDAIREFGPDHGTACSIKSVEGYGPVCSVPEIVGFYPGCLSPETLTLRVRVDDNKTRSFGPWNRSFAEFTVSYTPYSESCDDCDVTVSCDEYMCGLVDALNNDLELKVNGEYYPDWMGDTISRPFRAVKLQPRWHSFCISPDVTGDCKDCTTISALTSFSFKEEENGAATSVSLAQFANPADSTKTLVSSLKSIGEFIENEIRKVLGKHSAFVVVSNGKGACCPTQIHIATCAYDFKLFQTIDSNSVEVEECQGAINIFPTFVKEGECKQCGTAPETFTPSCGIAIIADQDPDNCDSYMNFVDVFTGRKVTIDVVSEGQMAKHSRVVTLQNGRLAANYGQEIQQMEYRQIAGGSGYTFSDGNNPTGPFGLPDKNTKLRSAVTADCKKSYCVTYINSRLQREFGLGGSEINRIVHGYVAIPQNDNTTLTSWYNFLKKLVNDSPNNGSGCKFVYAKDCQGELIS